MGLFKICGMFGAKVSALHIKQLVTLSIIRVGKIRLMNFEFPYIHQKKRLPDSQRRKMCAWRLVRAAPKFQRVILKRVQPHPQNNKF